MAANMRIAVSDDFMLCSVAEI